MPRRPFHWRVHKHCVHTYSNDQLGLAERDEGTYYPVFMHLWATNLPGLRSDAAQTRRLFTSGNEERPHAPTAPEPSRSKQCGFCNMYSHSGKVAIRVIHTSKPFPMMCFSEVLPKESQVPDCSKKVLLPQCASPLVSVIV